MIQPPFTSNRLQVFTGLNVYCAFPAVAARLEMHAALPALTRDRVAAIEPCLISALPELADDAYLPPVANLRPRDDAPAALAITVAWLAARLQNIANACVRDIACYSGAGAGVIALSGYQVAEIGVRAMQLACALVAAALQDREPAAGRGKPDTAIRRQLADFFALARNWHLDVASHTIASLAGARGIPHYRICPSSRFLQLGQGVHQRHAFETLSDLTSDVGAKIAHNKIAARHLLKSLGVPTPDQVPVGALEQAQQAAAQLGYPVVVKPSHGLQTRGVTVDVRNPRELADAYRTAAQAGLGGVVVENFVRGWHHRLTVIGGRLVAAVKWVPAHVIGDGIRTIEQLMTIVNRDPRRGANYGHDFEFGRTLARISPNAEMDRMLAHQGYDYSSVPLKDALVRLHGVTTMASGGSGIDVTGSVHTDVRDMAELIARAFKLDAVGVDYLTDDVAQTCRDGGGAVCEVNACPGFQGHWAIGCDREKIIGPLLDCWFPGGATVRVPTVAIARGPGAATVSRMVADIFGALGKTTALAYSGGVYVGSRKVRNEDSAGGWHAQAVMLDPRVEAVVMELGCANLAESGMPVDRCDTGAVLGLACDYTPPPGIDAVDAIARLQMLVVKSATRYAVLNADDAHCARMAEALGRVPICWVSMDPEHPVLAAHAAANGMSVTLAGTGADAEFVCAQGARRQSITRVRDICASTNAIAPVREALFAAAIACALDIPASAIAGALESFTPRD